MSGLLTQGIHWITSLFDAGSLHKETSYTQLKNDGLLEEMPNKLILHDTELGKYVTFEGTDKEQKLAAYLGGIAFADVETKDKIMPIAIFAIMTVGQVIVPVLLAAERLHLLDRIRSLANAPDVSCKAGLLAGSLCFVTGNNHKEACVGMLALSYLQPAFAKITVIGSIPDQVVYANQKFNLNLRTPDVFYESDPSLSLSVVAKQSDGEVLPSWLTFSVLPSLVGTIKTYSAYDVYVVSNIAYVADYTAGLKIIDVSNSNSPSLLGTIKTYSAYDVYVVSNIAYVADSSAGLKIIDVSNPQNSSILGMFATSYADDVYVVSNIAYLVGWPAGLKLIDVSNPRAPSLLGTIAISATSFYVVSNIAYLVDESVGLKLIDVSNPRAPSLLGTIAISATSVYVVSNIAYLVDESVGLKLIDVSNSNSPFLLGTIQTSNAYNVYVVSNIAYVVDRFVGLKLIDVSNPTSPFLLGTFASSSLAESVYVVSNIAYVAASSAGLKLIDIYSTNFNGISTKLEGRKNYNITLQATNNLGETASTFFNLNVRCIKVVYPISNQEVHIGNNFDFSVPANTFSDSCDNALYSSQLSDGNPLPSWLTFTPASRQFSGTPSTDADIKAWDIAVIATDSGDSAYTNFTLNALHQGITVNGNIPDKQSFANVYFTYTFPSSLFVDGDSLKLDYSALLVNGDSLPLWLGLNSNSRTFYGTPTGDDVGMFKARLFAKDNYDEKSVDFEMTVYPFHYQSPIVNKGISSHSVAVGKYFSYVVPDDAFTNPNNDKLTYKAFLSGGNPLPSWLAFAPDIKTFSGSPKSEGTLDIVVTVTDSYESTAQTSFALKSVNKTLEMIKTFASVGGPMITAFGFLITAYANRANIRNYLKRKKYQLEDQTVKVGNAFIYKIKTTEKIKDIRVLRFTKRTWKDSSCGDYLTSWWNNHYEELPAEQKLPNWLSYDCSSNKLKTVPAEFTKEYAGDYKVRVVGTHKYVEEEFVLHVVDPNALSSINVAPGEASELVVTSQSSMHEPLLNNE